MKKALRVATAGIMALAVIFSCTVFPNLTNAAPVKTKVTVSSPVKVKNGQTGKYTLYQIKGKRADVKIKAKASSGKLKFKSSNKKILTVSSKGIVKTTGKKTGKAVITVYSAKNKKANAKIAITVKNFEPKLSKTALVLTENESETLKVIGKGVKSVTFKSSNPKVATVDKNGKVTAVAAGSAVISAIAASASGVKATLTANVTVAKAVYKFYLTRHGQTVFNTLDIGQGWTDSPLTKDSKDKKGNTVYGGISMAQQLGKSMATIPFDKAYSSDLTRAYETAEYILAGRNVPIIADKNLRETNLGALEGKPASADEKGSQTRFTDAVGWTDVGGENMAQTANRVEKAMKRIIAENKSGGTFLVTSHGGALIAFLDKLLGPMAHGGDMSKADPMFLKFMAKWKGSMPNCAVSVVTFADGKFTVESISDTSYLGKMAPDLNAPKEDPEYTFYLTRHGETMFNVLGVAQGWCDAPLTKDTVDPETQEITKYGGVSMAKKLGETMAKIPFDKAYTSDLTRAYETAEYIIGERKIPLVQDKDLRETNCGDIEGQVDGAGYMARIGWDDGYKDVNGESMHETAVRFDRAIKKIVQDNKNGGTFLVTSHGGAITAYLDSLIGPNAEGNNGDMEKADQKFLQFMGTWHGAMPNCAVTIVKYSKTTGFTVEKISDVSYLGELAPTP